MDAARSKTKYLNICNFSLIAYRSLQHKRAVLKYPMTNPVIDSEVLQSFLGFPFKKQIEQNCTVEYQLFQCQKIFHSRSTLVWLVNSILQGMNSCAVFQYIRDPEIQMTQLLRVDRVDKWVCPFNSEPVIPYNTSFIDNDTASSTESVFKNFLSSAPSFESSCSASLSLYLFLARDPLTLPSYVLWITCASIFEYWSRTLI